MKVKLKDGRVLQIEEGSLIALDNNGETIEVQVEQIESIINNGHDWNNVRIQASIAAMQNLCGCERFWSYPEEDIAKYSVRQADALIEELKKGK